MTKEQIEKEFDTVNFELRENRPNISGPFPNEVVRRRELLLEAQVILGNVLSAKQGRDINEERFYETVYYRTMDAYYNWGAPRFIPLNLSNIGQTFSKS